jgi:hypothetical protein
MALKHTHTLSGTGPFPFESLSELVTAVSEAAGESRDWKNDITVNLLTENRTADGVRYLDWEIQVTW